MSSTEPKLSKTQAAALEKFRESVQDLLPGLPYTDDHYLLKWLRARNFNLKNAEAMIRRHAEFRVQMDVDFLVNNWKPSEVVEKYFSGGLCGWDREGSPLWWEVVGDLDPSGLMRSERPGVFLRSKVRELELMLAECQRQTHLLGRQVGSMVLIVDLNNLSRRHLWRPFLNSNLEELPSRASSIEADLATAGAGLRQAHSTPHPPVLHQSLR
ncbi:SEC14-like protein 2 isoform X2 [Lethenteron reissneri]|uniref:SEC14-like protein 2 isoform X2 n=1 Tax=Lethenteron reissneri TaxID=7753 RepID=UPI002AB6DDDD|nr:SEC14-like protein 2 isoform X2 [Lethenteron reissneri]